MKVSRMEDGIFVFMGVCALICAVLAGCLYIGHLAGVISLEGSVYDDTAVFAEAVRSLHHIELRVDTSGIPYVMQLSMISARTEREQHLVALARRILPPLQKRYSEEMRRRGVASVLVRASVGPNPQLLRPAGTHATEHLVRPAATAAEAPV